MNRKPFPYIDYDYYQEPSLYCKSEGCGSLYNLQKWQIMSNSQNKFYNLQLGPNNAVPAKVQGNFVDFKLESVPGFIYKSFVLSYTINNTTGASVNLLPGPMQV